MAATDNLGMDVNAMSKDEMNGEIIQQTLDVLNSSTYGCDSHSDKKSCSSTSESMSESYNFQKDVLSAAYDTKGGLVNSGI